MVINVAVTTMLEIDSGQEARMLSCVLMTANPNTFVFLKKKKIAEVMRLALFFGALIKYYFQTFLCNHDEQADKAQCKPNSVGLASTCT